MKNIEKNLSNAIRFLSMDAVQNANSGHPGMPMGMADVATILFKYFLKFNPKNPNWLNRDRFILSAGHGSMLLYSLLYLTGYKSVSLNDIKKFRQLNSICAGHPEYHPNSGIETTTGPLGQGIANSVGFAIAEKILKKKLGSNLINHKTYVLAGDGCLMEGISHEAMSLAGHLRLNNLIMLFDNNSISIDGPTSLAVSSHGSPLGIDEIKLVRKKLDWDYKPFKIPQKILTDWRKIGEKGVKKEKIWNKTFSRHKLKFKNIIKNKFSSSIIKQKKDAIKNFKTIATRKSSEEFLSAILKERNTLIGGSADLAGSNNTKTKLHKIINSSNFDGNYIHYGVREHAMSGIMNGLALHSNFIPYGGTFLIFSDYCKPSIRLSAIMKQKVIYIMTHDSIGLGEDGPTHQPVEQLAALRSIPNLNVLRPADQTETIECWDIALNSNKTPSILALTRQNLKPIRKSFSKKNQCSMGAYEVIRTGKNINLTILASGSEVNLAIETSHKLAKQKIYSKVISMPCQEIFDKQNKSYKDKILKESKNTFSIEAGSKMSWEKYIEKGLSFSIEDFGKSAPYKKVYDHFGLSSEKISKKIKFYLKK